MAHRQLLTGYWHNFENPCGPAFPLAEVVDGWDVVVVAFAHMRRDGAIDLRVDAAAGSEADFVHDVRQLRRAGKRVVLSVGGQNSGLFLHTEAQVANFVDSVHAQLLRFGFDGLDLDFEERSGLVHGSPLQARIVDAVRRLKARADADLYVSITPEWPYVQGGYAALGGHWGAYLPIIDGLREALSAISVQYYNNGAMATPYSKHPAPEGSIDMLVGGTRMLIEGFPLASGGAGWFRGVRPEQVAIAVPSTPRAACSGYCAAPVVVAALDCITRGSNASAMRSSRIYPGFHGITAWSINWDRATGGHFCAKMAAHLRDADGSFPLPPGGPPC